MTLTGVEFIRQFESVVPLYLAEEGDPVGLHIGTLNKPIKKVMMTLDVRPAVVKEAIEKKVDLIIAKHPPIFRPVARLTTDDFQTKMYADLLAHDIAVYAAHTNMDIVDNGLNDWFCELLGITDTDYLRQTHQFLYKKISIEVDDSIIDELVELGAQVETTGTLSHVRFSERKEKEILAILQKKYSKEDLINKIEVDELVKETFGIGRIGKLDSPVTVLEMVDKVKNKFGLNAVTLVTDTKDKMIETVAICGGSGEKFYKDALKKGADLYITGDVYFHTAHDMIEEGLTVIDPGHYIESICKSKYVELFNEWKNKFGWSVDFIISEVDTNPFEIL